MKLDIILAENEVEVQGDLTVEGSAKVQGKFSVNRSLETQGSLKTDEDVEAQGDLTFSGSVRFGNAETPMRYTLTSGSMNPDRPVLAHSPQFQNRGLLHRATKDRMIFQGGGSPDLTINLSQKRVGVETDNPQHNFHVNGSATDTQGFRAVSDARCKEDVEPIDEALEMVQALHGVCFQWCEDACEGMRVANGPQVGFLAQEVAEVLPEAVQQGEDDYYTLGVSAVVPEAVKAWHQTLSVQAAQIESLARAGS